MTLKTSFPRAAMLLLSVLLVSGCKNDGGGAPPQGAAPPPPKVQVADVKRESVSVFRDYTAELKPVQTVDIRTRVGGELDSVHFAEGSMVQQGQVLFQIDAAPYYSDISAAEAALAKAQAGVAQAQGQVSQARGSVSQAQARLQRALTQVNLQETQADLARAQATLDAAEREVQRYKPLEEQGAVPGQQYDQAKDRRDVARAERDAVKAKLTNTKVSDQADVGVARADVQSAQASLESAQASVLAAQAVVQDANNNIDKANLYLGYTTIKAPFTGFIGRLNLDRGTMIVQGNAVLATLSSANPIYADFSISESEYLALKQGQGLSGSPFGLTLANGEEYSEHGQFVLADTNVDAKTGTLTLRVRFENPDFLLKPGGFGRVTMKNHQVDEAIVIPQKAVFSNQSLTSVYVVKPDNSVESRTVTLGDRTTDLFVVKDGLKEGESIIVEGLQRIRPGITVVPEKVGAPNKAGTPDKAKAS